MNLQARGLLDASLRQLASHVPEIQGNNIGAVIRVLFDVAEILPWATRSVLEVPAEKYVLETVKSLLQRMGRESERLETVMKALGTSKGLMIPVELVDAAISAAAEGRPLFSADGIDQVKKEIVRKLREADPRSRLQERPRLGYLLNRWRDWEGVEGPMTAAQAIATEPDGALRLCRAFSSRGISSEPDEDGHVFYRLDPDALQQFVSLDTIVERLRLVNEMELSDDDRLILKGARRALRMRNA
jgi:hypothetical protein